MDEASGAAEQPVALDVDGIAVVSFGTVLWGIALVVAITLHARLARDGHTWWIAAAAIGFGLGLLGIGYCVRRRKALITLRRPAKTVTGHSIRSDVPNTPQE